MMCSMCSTMTLGPGNGWQCKRCKDLNCRHILRCKCGQNRYEQEQAQACELDKSTDKAVE